MAKRPGVRLVGKRRRGRPNVATSVVGAVDLNERCDTASMISTRCQCEPGCATCGYGKHQSVHGPEYGQPPGSRPWHHEFVAGEGPPVYDGNAWFWGDHPRQEWPATECHARATERGAR